MKRYLKITKQVGETPLQALERARDTYKLPKNLPIAYAGRLDPMASGTLLLLLGDECKKQTLYHGLDKKYSFSVVFGVQSDTQDVLGKVTTTPVPESITKKTIKEVISSCRGYVSLPYPHYSSKTVKGKPLHTWTLEGKIESISIPIKKSIIHSIYTDRIGTISGQELFTHATNSINLLPTVTDPKKALGRDFRRSEILEDWDTFLKSQKETAFYIADIHCIASSGTYMRSLANHIAEKVGTSGIALSINRTRIGTYKGIYKNLGIWLKTI